MIILVILLPQSFDVSGSKDQANKMVLSNSDKSTGIKTIAQNIGDKQSLDEIFYLA